MSVSSIPILAEVSQGSFRQKVQKDARQWKWVHQHAKHWVGKMQGSGVGKDARQWNQTLYHSFVMNHDSLHACVIIVRYCEPLYP